MIYRIVRGIVKICLSVFFKKIIVTGSEHIPDQGPLIIVANHPNTFMDPMIIASITRQRIGFVANAGIFTNKLFTSLFRFFHVIPIYRKKDVAEGEKPDNREAFAKCYEYLSEKRTFLIFPEGISNYELKLREIKTGTARIAFGFEKQKNFESNLKILPVALDYSDSIQFRSMVSVTVNAPLIVVDYKNSFLIDEFNGVNKLTEDIRKILAKNIPQTSGKDQEKFLVKSHKFYTAYYEPDADLYENPKRSLELRLQLSKAINYILVNNTQLYNEIQNKLIEFFRGLKSEHITTGFYTNRFLKRSKAIVSFTYILKLSLLLPFYIVGLFANYIPYILPSKIFNSLKIDITYKGPVQMVSGLVTFPLYYTLLIFLIRKYINAELWFTFTFLALFVASGFISMYFWTEVRRFARVVRFYFFIPGENKIKMLELRDAILNKIAIARESLNQ